MHRTAVLLVALGLAAVSLAGCLEPEPPAGPAPKTGPSGGDTNTTPPANATNVTYRPFQVNATLDQAQMVRGGVYLVATSAEWRTLWNQGENGEVPELPVDLKKERVAAAFLGYGGDSCVDIAITNVTKADGVTYVEVFTKRPSRDEVCLEYYHVPFDLVALPKDETQVKFIERGEIPTTDPASPIQFVMEESYAPGTMIDVTIRNVGTQSYQYNEMYQACDLDYFTAEGREFKIPPGTHCDLIVYWTIQPGETVTLFRWNATECTKDMWGCAESKPLPAGTYHIRGTFFGPEGSNAPAAFAGATFRIE